jgi:ketosteroid isomerase-like protein
VAGGISAEDQAEVVRRAFAAFTLRDVDSLLELVDEDVEFLPVGTTSLTGQTRSYRGHQGIRSYFEDIERVWQELRVIPARYRTAGPYVLVLGSVYARDAEGNLTDIPTGWIWKLRGGKLIWGRAYKSRKEALLAMSGGEPEKTPIPDENHFSQ